MAHRGAVLSDLDARPATPEGYEAHLEASAAQAEILSSTDEDDPGDEGPAIS